MSEKRGATWADVVVKIGLPTLLVILSVGWGITHFAAQPGERVSVWGLFDYTKREAGESKAVNRAKGGDDSNGDDSTDTVVDTEPPTLAWASPPADEDMKRGELMIFQLRFSEPIDAATLAGTELKFDSARTTGNVSVRIPTEIGDDMWSLDWNASDDAGNGASDVLVFQLTGARAPEGWRVVDDGGTSSGWALNARDPRTGVRFRLIEPGNYTISERPGDTPVTSAEITRPYYLAVTEVSVGQWRAFQQETDHRSGPELAGHGETVAENTWWLQNHPHARWDNPLPLVDFDDFELREDHPVSLVTWDDALAFCNHYGYQLPTEVQWEIACLAGNTFRQYWWGGVPPTPASAPDEGTAWFQVAKSAAGKHCNFADSATGERGDGNRPAKDITRIDDGFVYFSPVHGTRPNDWGFHDMAGNVGEWCRDAPDIEFYEELISIGPDPLVFYDHVTVRGVRGGSWFDSLSDCRPVSRKNVEKSLATVTIGFRPAKNLE